MIGILAILFFAAAVIVHGGAVTVHTHWLDWEGLALAGLLCLSLTGFSPPAALTRWRRHD